MVCVDSPSCTSFHVVVLGVDFPLNHENLLVTKNEILLNEFCVPSLHRALIAFFLVSYAQEVTLFLSIDPVLRNLW